MKTIKHYLFTGFAMILFALAVGMLGLTIYQSYQVYFN